MTDEIRRGEDAKRLLAEPLLVEAFDAIHAAMLANLMQTNVNDTEAQRGWVVSLQILAKVKRHLEQVIVSGELAKEELAQQNALSHRKKR